MLTYKLQNSPEGVLESIFRSDGWNIPICGDNTDYIAYLKWVSEGNTPLPADEGAK